MSFYKERSFIIIALLIGAILGAGAVMVFKDLKADTPMTCSLESTKTPISVLDMKDLTTDDKKFKLSFVGYLQYAKAGTQDLDEKYVALEPKKVTSVGPKTNPTSLISLATDCARLKFFFMGRPQTLQFITINMNTSLGIIDQCVIDREEFANRDIGINSYKCYHAQPGNPALIVALVGAFNYSFSDQ